MKKRTLSAITAVTVFAITIVSCGSDTAKTETKQVEETAEVTEEVATEEVIEESAAIDGADLFASNGCVACHQLEAKTVGPAIKEIAEAYADNADGLGAFLNGEADPIVDVAQAAVMAPQIETTKAMSVEERAAIVDYLLK